MKLVEKHWDYTKHAEFYEYRPNYAPSSIDMLSALIYNNHLKQTEREREREQLGKQKVNGCAGLVVADIGAGSGNLSIMLLDRGFKVMAIEPNDAMREIGIKRTTEDKQNINWIKAAGLNTSLSESEVDWVTFGSSFNVLDQSLALKEAYRILKPASYFTCMWNHRDLNCPIQEMAEEIISNLIPSYQRGVRREDQRPVIQQNNDLFDQIIYLEEDFYFHQNIDNYIKAWRSVKNPYWDLDTKEGNELFEKISYQIRHKLPSEFNIKYTTRSWSVKSTKLQQQA